MNIHLSSQFDAELDGIRAQMTQMGGLIEVQLDEALKLIGSHDVAMAEQIIRNDKQIDAMEMAIDNACLHLIARRQPTAVDLRLVMAIAKAVKDMERMGDEAKKIAKAVRKISERGLVGGQANEVDLRHLGEQVVPMVHDVLDAFVRTDADTAVTIVRKDKDIDNLFRGCVRQLVTFMMEDPRTISTALDLVFIAKSLERVGDHAKNIAENVIFIAQGRDVRHQGDEVLDAE